MKSLDFGLSRIAMNRLSLPDRAKILGCLTEGMSLRAASRLADVSINTVSKLLVDVGTACDLYQNEKLRNLECKRVQCDEIWSFVGMKEKNVPEEKRGEFGAGDVYTWTAPDADTKLMVSWLVGRRDPWYAEKFIGDLRSRIANPVQLTTEGHLAYLTAVEKHLGHEADYAMLVKLFAHTPKGGRYSPPECIGTKTQRVSGNPDPVHISTSFVERQNLNMRMSMRRFTRLTNAFSRKVANLECAVALHFMHYNFGRVHKTLRVTPAMEAGIADHVWTLEEISKLAD